MMVCLLCQNMICIQQNALKTQELFSMVVISMIVYQLFMQILKIKLLIL